MGPGPAPGRRPRRGAPAHRRPPGAGAAQLTAPRLRPLQPAELDAEQAAVHAAITASRPEAASSEGAGGGFLPGPFDAMLRAPRTGGALAALGDALRHRGVLPDRVRELAVLQVATYEGSAFEWAAHAPVAAALGWSDAALDAVRAGEVPPSLDDPAERAAHAAVAALLATGDLGAGAWADLLGGIGEAGAVELLTLVGYYRLLALQMRVLRIG